MASAAIPYIFPAVYVEDQFYADGAVRQSRPLSSVLNMDASRLLVIGVRDEQGNLFTGEETNYPSLGKIAGYVLDTLFMDGMFHDLETVMNVNDLINELKKQAKGKDANFEDKRLVSTHIIVPSEDIRDLVIKHRQRLPRNVRLLLSGKDDDEKSGGQLMSYLLFDSAFTQELMDLGYRDAMQQKDKLYDFFCADEIPELIAPSHIKHWFI